MTKIYLSLGLLFACSLFVPSACAEFRTAKDMQKECRIALKVFKGTAAKSSKNVRFAGECVGYIQGASDASLLPLSKKGLYRVCSPDNISTNDLIQRFIAFVDANPNDTLASTAVQAMLGPDYGSCKKNANRGFPPHPLSVVPAVKGLDRKQRLDMNKNGLDINGQACRHANLGAGRDIRGSRRSLRSQQEWIDSGPWYAKLILA